MMVKALVNFAGKQSMYRGQEKDISDPILLQDLLNAGYVAEIKTIKPKKAGKT